MQKLTSNFWSIESFRPGMRIVDSLRHRKTREVLESYKNDTISDNRDLRDMKYKNRAHLSLDLDDDEKESTVVITADEDGRFTTDDPVLAASIYKFLMAGPEINHPVTRVPVKCVVDRNSPPIPTDAELAKLQKEAAKKAS